MLDLTVPRAAEPAGGAVGEGKGEQNKAVGQGPKHGSGKGKRGSKSKSRLPPLLEPLPIVVHPPPAMLHGSQPDSRQTAAATRIQARMRGKLLRRKKKAFKGKLPRFDVWAAASNKIKDKPPVCSAKHTLVVFDFDCTLSSVHMYHTLRTSEGKAERKASHPRVTIAAPRRPRLPPSAQPDRSAPSGPSRYLTLGLARPCFCLPLGWWRAPTAWHGMTGHGMTRPMHDRPTTRRSSSASGAARRASARCGACCSS